MPVLSNVNFEPVKGLEALSGLAQHGDMQLYKWFWKTPRPDSKIIHEHYLKNAPVNAITVLRRESLKALSENLKIENPYNTMEKIAAFVPTGVDRISKIKSDNNQTTTFLIPIDTEAGQLLIHVNDAYGVLWSLSPDHGLLSSQELMIPRLSDERIPSHLSTGEYFIESKTLAMKTQINAKGLANEIHDFLSGLFKLPDIDTSVSLWTMGANSPVVHDAYGMAIGPRSGKDRPYINLFLGDNGVKFVDFFPESGYSGPTVRHRADLVKKAYRIKNVVGQYYSYSK